MFGKTLRAALAFLFCAVAQAQTFNPSAPYGTVWDTSPQLCVQGGDNFVCATGLLVTGPIDSYVYTSNGSPANLSFLQPSSLVGNPTANYAQAIPITLGAGLSFSGTTLTASGSGGSVTSVSVVTANGYSGTVATATTTPAITITGPNIPAGANPSASVGLTAVNGVSPNFMAADSAPALSQSIVPTWTGIHTWSLSEPRLILSQSGAGTDLKNWDFDVASGVFALRTRTDADGAGNNVLSATRGATIALTNIAFGYSAAGSYSFPFTGTTTFNGLVTNTSTGGTAGFQVSSATPTFGWFASGTSGSRAWTAAANGLTWSLNAATDAVASPHSAFLITRTSGTTTIASMVYGGSDNPSHTFDGAVLMPTLAASSAATTGTVCWTTSTGNLNVDTTTTCLLSDGRLKMNVEPLDVGIAEVMKLKPVSYELKPEVNPQHLGRQVGLIAQDVMKVDSRLAANYQTGPNKGTPSGVRYEQMVALLVKAVQEQQQEISDLRRQIKPRRN